jgi:quercetin dioxygenase-like cupin family protein
MPPEIQLFRWDALPLDKVTEMVACKTVSGADLRLTQAYFKKGTIVPVHRDDAEQLIYPLQGALRARVGGEEVTVREGDVLVVPAGAARQAEMLDDTFLLMIARVARGPAG